MTTKFGVEIECVGWGGSTYLATESLSGGRYTLVNEGYNQRRASDVWRVVQEYSITNGVEIISPPIPFSQEGLDFFGGMIEHIRLNGGSMDYRCGMHVHVDANFLRSATNERRKEFFEYLFMAYQRNEAVFDQFVKPNRRGNANRFCKSLQNKTLEHIYLDREHKLNVNSFSLHGTIEFRHYHGTLNAEAAKAWVTLCVTFLANVRKAFENRVGESFVGVDIRGVSARM